MYLRKNKMIRKNTQIPKRSARRLWWVDSVSS